MRKIDWKKELNGEQFKAVMHKSGPLLVLAGAGSGKTRTMTYRVAWLSEQGIDPLREILLVTFTNKAAKEMLTRVQELTGMPLDGMYAGTFHHLANRFLKAHYHLMDLSENYTIWDEDKSRQEVDIIIADLAGLKSKDAETDIKLPGARAVLEVISYCANTNISIDRAIEEKFRLMDKHRMLIGDVAREYKNRMKRSNALDFDSLLLGWHRLLRANPDIRKHYAKQFKHVLVDEFQDTNSIQMDILDMLSSHHQNLMVVGDDFQSIYSFRGADYDHIMRFPRLYPTAKIYRLVTNYRSTPEIVTLANTSICNNRNQFKKELRSGREGGSRPLLVSAANQSVQAGYVAKEIRQLATKGATLDTMAVLYRAHFHAMEMQMELTRQKIPFKIVSGLGFFRQAHILDVVAYLTLVHNPQDEASLVRLLRKTKGVGSVSTGMICSHIRNSEDKAAALVNFPDPRIVSVNGRAGLTTIRNTIAGMYRVRDKEPLGKLIEVILANGYREYLEANYENAESRITDVREMARFANDYDSLDKFLEEVALTRDAEGSDTDKGKVLLSTVHQAKGLEWNTVFMIGVAGDLFPLARVVREEGDKGMEEERRLFYVAVTRAKDNLHIICPAGDYKRGNNLLPSCFIEELPRSVFKAAEAISERRDTDTMGAIPLDVPFIEKDQAKALGAAWDPVGKFWYVPPGKDPEKFVRWLTVKEVLKLKKGKDTRWAKHAA